MYKHIFLLLPKEISLFEPVHGCRHAGEGWYDGLRQSLHFTYSVQPSQVRCLIVGEMLSLRCPAKQKQSIFHYPAEMADPLSSQHYMKVCPNKWGTLWNHRDRTETKRQDRILVTGHYTINDGNQLPGAPLDVTDHFILFQCLFSQSVWMSRFREARRPAKSPKYFLLALALFFMPEKTRIHNCSTTLNNDAIKLNIISHKMSENELENHACIVLLTLKKKRKWML